MIIQLNITLVGEIFVNKIHEIASSIDLTENIHREPLETSFYLLKRWIRFIGSNQSLEMVKYLP